MRVQQPDGGQRTVTVEIDGWKKARPDQGAPAADAAALVGTEVILVDAGVVGISKRKSMRVWDASGPGAWLTHAAPPTHEQDARRGATARTDAGGSLSSTARRRARHSKARDAPPRR